MKFGRVENGKVLEVVEAVDQDEIDSKYHPDIASQFVQDSNNEIEQGWNYDGTTFSEPEPIVLDPITPEQVKAEANRRITNSGHDWMVIRSISDQTPVPQEILDYAANIRNDAAALEAMEIIPQEYKDDSYWTQLP